MYNVEYIQDDFEVNVINLRVSSMTCVDYDTERIFLKFAYLRVVFMKLTYYYFR